MKVVLLHLITTGPSIAADDLLFVGACRLCTDSGAILQRLHTYVKPDKAPLEVIRSCTAETHLSPDDLRDLPSCADVLRQVSSFVGQDVLVAQRGPLIAMPVLRELCERHSLPSRFVRVLDMADLGRQLLGAEATVTIRELAWRLGLIQHREQRPNSPVQALDLQVEIFRRLWRLLAPVSGSWPAPLGHAILPQLKEAA